MSGPNRSDVSHDPQFDRILAECIQAMENGDVISADDWVVRYPAYEHQLREFIANNQRLNDIVPRIPGGQPEDANSKTILSSDSSHPAAAAAAAPLADVLKYFGDYELIEEIARGGMGVVYRGRQVSLNRPVAVKMILAGEFASADDVARFRLEAEAAANLDHPGIVPIYEIGERAGKHYFSMKYIAGESLAHWLRNKGDNDAGKRRPPLTLEDIREKVRLVVAVVRAVHYAHQRGIIHRDLKPANILIDGDGAPHVTDFGLAKRLTGDSQLTHTGAIVGTPSYMAPEQAKGNGRGVTTAADIYGLGAILYAVLGLRPPFDGDSPLDTLLKVQNEAPEPLSRLCPQIDRDLESICDKCLAKDPELRYRSAGELGDDLDHWLNGEPISTAPPGLSSILWRWVSTHFRSAAVVILLGLLTGLFVSDTARFHMAHNVGSHLGIYKGSFPQHEPPWMLTVIAAYPLWISIVSLPCALVCYFSMGWLTDRLVLPKNAATALLAGMGLGSAAAITAFLAGIGWATLNQVAVWPSQPDLELMAAAIDNDTSFSEGRRMADVYPGVPARQVMKKALADLYSHIPQALIYGMLFAVGILFLPATLQTWAAYVLRRRGDGPWHRFGHLIELTLPVSLLLIAWGFLLFERPVWACVLSAIPLLGFVALERSRRWSRSARRNLAVGMGMVGLIGAGLFSETLFSPASTGGVSFGLLLVGTAAAGLAVFQRWPWWARLIVYGVWLATFSYIGGVAGSFDPVVNHSRMIASLIGSSIVVLLTAFAAWWAHSRQSAIDSLRS